jgi:hypothetical protein
VLVLLAALPYAATVIAYWIGTGALFRAQTAPSSWSWRLIGPVLVGGFTPIALAAKTGLADGERWLLLSATGVAVFFTLVGMGLLREESYYFKLQVAVGIGSRRFAKWPRWRFVMVLGSLVLAYGATVNVIVAGA